MNKKFEMIALEVGGSLYPTVNTQLLEKFAQAIVNNSITALVTANSTTEAEYLRNYWKDTSS